MSTLPGLLKVSREVRDQIYRHIVSTDQPDQPLLRVEHFNDSFTHTTTSLGLLGTCHQLRGEFLNFFVDHRQHVFEDPLVFANTFLATIGNAHRIQCLRHLGLVWPTANEPCTRSSCTRLTTHYHAAVPSNVTVTGHMRTVNTVIHTYPELAQCIETSTFEFQLLDRLDQASSRHNQNVFEQVTRLLGTIDAVLSKQKLQRRYFLVQTDAAGVHQPRPTRVLIRAVAKRLWDRIADGAYVQDSTCLTCKLDSRWWHTRHHDYWVRLENCKEDGHPNGSPDIYTAHHLEKVKDKNWKLVFHGRDEDNVFDWYRVFSKQALKKHSYQKKTRKRKRTEAT